MCTYFLGTYDGIGGTLKREASKYSLSQPYENQILTPKEFYNFCQTKCPGIKSFFISSEEIKTKSLALTERFNNAKTLKGTREFHCFLSRNDKRLRAKRFSNSEKSVIRSVSYRY